MALSHCPGLSLRGSNCTHSCNISSSTKVTMINILQEVAQDFENQWLEVLSLKKKTIRCHGIPRLERPISPANPWLEDSMLKRLMSRPLLTQTSRNCYCQHYNHLMASQMQHMNILGLSSSFVHPLTHKIKYKQLKASKPWLRLEKLDMRVALNSRFAEGNLTSISYPLYSKAIFIFI